MTALKLCQILKEQVARLGNCQVLIHDERAINTVTIKGVNGEIVFVLSEEISETDLAKVDPRALGVGVTLNDCGPIYAKVAELMDTLDNREDHDTTIDVCRDIAIGIMDELQAAIRSELAA